MEKGSPPEIAALRLRQHVVAPVPALPIPRVVLSSLGTGESLIGSTQPSIKLVLEGEEIYRIGKQVYRLTPGCLLFIDRGDPVDVTIRRNKETKGLCIYFGQHDIGPAERVPLIGRAALRASNADPLSQHLRAMGIAAHEGSIDFEASAARMLDCAVAVVRGTMREAREQHARLDVQRPGTRQNIIDRVEIARAFLHDNFARTVTLKELAAVSGLSTFHLARHFSAVVGVPPSRYHLQFRMRHARELLRLGHHSVTEVAELLGYSDLSAFSHAFRREFDIAPALFAKLR